MPSSTDPRPNVLLTGFGPFPGVRENLSGSLVKRLGFQARALLPQFRFVVAVLPTEWVRAPQIVAELYQRHDPVLSLHFGVSSKALDFRIETEASNFCRMSADDAGNFPVLTQVLDGGASALPASIDAASIVMRLNERGHHASLSDDAGSYLCNAVLYHSLTEAEQRGGHCRVGFVHIPADAGLLHPFDFAVSGALEILKFALEGVEPAATLTSV
jgi:pyroglutamyl-peptidase